MMTSCVERCHVESYEFLVSEVDNPVKYPERQLGLFQENLPGRHGTEPNFFHRGGGCSDSFSFLGGRGR